MQNSPHDTRSTCLAPILVCRKGAHQVLILTFETHILSSNSPSLLLCWKQHIIRSPSAVMTSPNCLFPVTLSELWGYWWGWVASRFSPPQGHVREPVSICDPRSRVRGSRAGALSIDVDPVVGSQPALRPSASNPRHRRPLSFSRQGGGRLHHPSGESTQPLCTASVGLIP